MKRSPFVLGVIALVLGRAAGAAYGAEISFPALPVRLISPYLPVGLTNILSRLIAAELSESWGPAGRGRELPTCRWSCSS